MFSPILQVDFTMLLEKKTSSVARNSKTYLPGVKSLIRSVKRRI
jgi:hypothetical protein